LAEYKHIKNGERLAKLRRTLLLSRKDLGDIMGVTRTAIHYYEKGRIFPSFDRINKLFKYAKKNGFTISRDDFIILRED